MKVRADIFTILFLVLSSSSVRDRDSQSKELGVINLAHGEVYFTTSNQSNESKAISVAHSEVDFTASKGGDSNGSATKVDTSRVALFAAREESKGTLVLFEAADAESMSNAEDCFGNGLLWVRTEGPPISQIYASPGPDDLPDKEYCLAQIPGVQWLPGDEGSSSVSVEAIRRANGERQAFEFVTRDTNKIVMVRLYSAEGIPRHQGFPVFGDPRVKRLAIYRPQPQAPKGSPGLTISMIAGKLPGVIADALDVHPSEWELPSVLGGKAQPVSHKRRDHPPGRSRGK